jgi:hypothetical protein
MWSHFLVFGRIQTLEEDSASALFIELGVNTCTSVYLLVIGICKINFGILQRGFFFQFNILAFCLRYLVLLFRATQSTNYIFPRILFGVKQNSQARYCCVFSNGPCVGSIRITVSIFLLLLTILLPVNYSNNFFFFFFL